MHLHVNKRQSAELLVDCDPKHLLVDRGVQLISTLTVCYFTACSRSDSSLYCSAPFNSHSSRTAVTSLLKLLGRLQPPETMHRSHPFAPDICTVSIAFGSCSCQHPSTFILSNVLCSIFGGTSRKCTLLLNIVSDTFAPCNKWCIASHARKVALLVHSAISDILSTHRPAIFLLT